ncbi:MAG: hypothetical protein GX621_06760 [Pirellulaceae bacterium]|nr:hypothetical protein [Pirellulaceae bacterium]
MRHPTSWLPAAVVLAGVLTVGVLVSNPSFAREEDDPFSPTRSETSPKPGAPAARGPRPPKVERRLVVEVIERPSAPDEARPETPEQRIRRLLESRVRVEVTDVTLAEFARELGERLGIPVVLKLRALEEIDIGSDLPLIFSTSNMRVRTLLRQLLDEHELGWLIENEVLAITTKEDAWSHRLTRIYDVRDLVTVYGDDGRYDFHFDPLKNVLTNTISYNTWQEYGGEGLVDAYEADRLQALVVSNTADVHEKIERLLADLRAHIPDDPAGKSNPAGGVWLKDAQLVKDVTPREPRVDPAEAAVRRALRKNVSVRLVDATLGEFARHIENLLGVQVRLKMRALEEFDIGSDLGMTVELSGVSARALLNLALPEHDLAWTIEDGCLMITTFEDAANTRYVRVYDVADLVLGKETVILTSEATSAEEKTPSTEPGDGSGPCSIRDYGFDSLIDLIASSVKCDTWQEYGGEGLIEPFDTAGMRVLVVNQTREVHNAIDELLAQLRQVRREGEGLPMPKRPAMTMEKWQTIVREKSETKVMGGPSGTP